MEYLSRARSFEDRRIILVSITVKGRVAVERANTIEDFLGASKDVRVDELRNSLQVVIQKLRPSQDHTGSHL